MGHPLIRAPYGIFQTADGWLGLVGIPIGSINSFFIAIGQPEAIVDDRVSELRNSPAALQWFKQLVARSFLQYNTEELCTLLEAANIRYAPVWNYADVAEDPGVWENGYSTEIKTDNGATHRVVGSPIRLSDTPMKPSATAPPLGEHNEEVFSSLGLTSAEISSLREQNII